MAVSIDVVTSCTRVGSARLAPPNQADTAPPGPLTHCAVVTE